MPNYYDILGVSKSADEKEIKQAFRRLARKYHPDLNPGDKESEKKFKEINEANEVLSDSENRKNYDKYGDNWKHAEQLDAQAKNSGPFTWTTTRGNGNVDYDLFGGLGDAFSDLGGIFGGFGRGRTATTSRQQDVAVTVSLEEAFSGTKRQITIPSEGRERRIEVTIPPGVDNGSRVHISVDKDTQLFLKMTVTPNPKYERKGSDLYMDVNVPFEDAILGGETEVQTLKSKISLKVPEGSQAGQRIRLAGQGMPKLNSPDSRGNLFVTIRPTLPKDLTEEEKELLTKYKELRMVKS